jgi:starch synthase
MSKKRVLFISQEITPYLPENNLSKIARNLPQGIQERGKEIRTFMPRYGNVNERRHQLHEVIRLSGMNMIIDDTDHPLIIKVASIQPARMQVYFIDNEEYFKRKSIFGDEDEPFFSDNDERAIFFCRGVLETVKKLGWAPDVVHCHGWMTSLVPLYLKKAFANDPIYSETKVVYSIYNNSFENSLDNKLAEKAEVEGVTSADLATVIDPTFENMNKIGMQYADAIVFGEETISEELSTYASSLNIPILEYKNEEEYLDAYSEFYDGILSEEGVLTE